MTIARKPFCTILLLQHDFCRSWSIHGSPPPPCGRAGRPARTPPFRRSRVNDVAATPAAFGQGNRGMMASNRGGTGRDGHAIRPPSGEVKRAEAFRFAAASASRRVSKVRGSCAGIGSQKLLATGPPVAALAATGTGPTFLKIGIVARGARLGPFLGAPGQFVRPRSVRRCASGRTSSSSVSPRLRPDIPCFRST